MGHHFQNVKAVSFFDPFYRRRELDAEASGDFPRIHELRQLKELRAPQSKEGSVIFHTPNLVDGLRMYKTKLCVHFLIQLFQRVSSPMILSRLTHSSAFPPLPPPPQPELIPRSHNKGPWVTYWTRNDRAPCEDLRSHGGIIAWVHLLLSSDFSFSFSDDITVSSFISH